jgi:hypothetical protein
MSREMFLCSSMNLSQQHFLTYSFPLAMYSLTGGCRVTSQSSGSLGTAAQLLGIDAEDLKMALVCRTMQAAKGSRASTIIQ